MSRRQLSFMDSSPACEEAISSSRSPSMTPTEKDFIPRSLSFQDEDSRDSGFESHESDNETSPQAGTTCIFNILKENRNSGTKRSLFSGKRSRDGEEMDFPTKKPRVVSSTVIEETEVTSYTMKTAVDRMDKEGNLIGDGSQPHRLPTAAGRHTDLKSVSPHTVSELLEGKYDDVISGYQIIDCRYSYEYEGGHIEGAINLYTEDMITDLITRLQSSYSQCFNRNILIFHCEFSSERGPKLLRHLRSMDRKLNSDCYPFLYYPEVYLLNGGYKAFYQQNQIQCEPRSYVPMLHDDYSKQLRHFRVKSKSWTAGEKQSMRSRRLMDASPMKLTLW